MRIAACAGVSGTLRGPVVGGLPAVGSAVTLPGTTGSRLSLRRVSEGRSRQG